MAQVPQRLDGRAPPVLAEVAVASVVKRRHGPLDRGLGQKHRIAARPPGFLLPLTHDHGINGVRLEGPAIGVLPMRGGPIRVIGRQAR
jgi:hypothetical protein